jgi:hypothetical protein
MAKDKTPAECTRMCVKDGMKFALAADRKPYALEDTSRNLRNWQAKKSYSREL